MHQFLLWFLHRFSPETAHGIVIWLLKCQQWVIYRLFRKTREWAAPAIIIAGMPRLSFTTRLGLAAGFDKNAEVFAALGRLGFGFVEVGTVTPKPQLGNAKPRIWRVDDNGLVNHLGFNNCGVELFRAHLLRYRANLSIPLLANIGKGRATSVDQAMEDYRINFDRLADCVDGFVVNISSPNTPSLGQLQNVEFLEKISEMIPRETPVLVKFSPDLADGDLRSLCTFVNEQRFFTGVVVTNTSRSLAEVYRSEGGLSGPKLFARSLACVGLARESLKSPKVVIGVGGISNGNQAREMLLAGADLIEVYTSFIYGGPALIRDLARATTL